MSVIDGAAALWIYSPSHTAADVSRILGIRPTGMSEANDAAPVSREGSPALPDVISGGSVSVWSLEVSADDARAHDPKGGGFGSIQMLVDKLAGAHDALAWMRRYYTMNIHWSGSSATEHNEFVLPSDLLDQLADLGCSLHCRLHPSH